MNRISDMRNLGIQMERWLKEADVATPDALRAIGSVEAWHRLRFVFGSRISIIALYAMEGALLDIDWRRLPLETRRDLDSAVLHARRNSPRKVKEDRAQEQ